MNHDGFLEDDMKCASGSRRRIDAFFPMRLISARMECCSMELPLQEAASAAMLFVIVAKSIGPEELSNENPALASLS
jgi:hypothetical protein